MVEVKNIVTLKYTVPSACHTACLPVQAFVPLPPGSGKPLVKAGERVREGQILALGNVKKSNVHASIPGIVSEFSNIPLPDGGNGEAVTIDLAGSFSFLGKTRRKKKLDSLEAEKIISIISEKGIENTFKYPCPLAEQMRGQTEGSREFLIVRLYDLDPTCCTDTFICNSYTHMVFEGAAVMAKALGTATIIFLYDTKSFAFKNPEKNIQEVLFSQQTVFIPINTAFYPCGGHNEIIDLIKKTGKKELSAVSVSDLMTDSATLYSVYEAVILNMPLMNRFVYVAGDGILQPKMFKVRIGTPISSLVEECGGFAEKSGKIIINGLIRGNEINDLNAPVTKYLKSVFVLSKNQEQDRSLYTCVHCGFCRQVCPAHLQPDAIYAHSNMYVRDAELCYDCGLCNTACPSRLPLNQTIQEILFHKKEEQND